MRKLYAIIVAIPIVMVLLINPSCTKDYLIPVEVDIPDTVSFSEYIIPIFNESCNRSGCHSSGGIAPNLSGSTAWSDLWLYGFIDTVSPSGSIIYQRMISTSNPMPPTGKLSGGEEQLILAWIEQGALNN